MANTSTSTAKTKSMVTTALMAALIFVATYAIRIPNPATGGYTHLGDCMIFLSVVLLGRTNGAMAAGIGGALSDFLAGSPMWILPTLVIKYVMAFIMGTVIKKHEGSKAYQLVGSVIGGIFQVFGYTVVEIAMFGKEVALISIPGNTLQTISGIVIFMILSGLFSKSLLKYINR